MTSATSASAPVVVIIVTAAIRSSIMAPVRPVVTMEAFMPTPALAVMVLFIKTPAIALTFPVAGPIGIGPVKITPVPGMGLVPGVPPRGIPVMRPGNIGGGISVIWGPAVTRAEKVIEDAIQKPVSVVVDPRGIGPDPGGGVNILGRGWIVITLSMPGRRHGDDRAAAQQDCQRQSQA